MLQGFIFQKKLQSINVTMNSFEWKQNELKILAFVVCSPKFPKNTLKLTDLPRQHFLTGIQNEEISHV